MIYILFSILVAQNLQNIIQSQIESVCSEQAGESEPEQGQPQLDPNAQAALMILLTAHQQAETGQQSILHNQEVVNVLQDLVCESQQPRDPYAEMMSIPGLQAALGQPPAPRGAGLPWSQNPVMPPAQPPPPPFPPHSAPQTTPISSPPTFHASQCASNSASANSSSQTTFPPTSGGGPLTSPPPLIANNLNLLSNTQTLNQLLSSLKGRDSTDFTSPPPSLPPPPPAVTSAPLAMPPNAPLIGRPPFPNFAYPPPTIPPPFQNILSGPSLPFLGPPPFSQLGPAQAPALLLNNGLQPGLVMPGMLVPGLQVTGPPPAAIFMPPQPSQLIPHISLPSLGHVQPPPPHSVPQPGIPPPSLPQPPAPRTVALPPPPHSLPQTPSPHSLKRKASILPSPEESPEGGYIGQHSQGLGGHYADSYWAKKRRRF